MSDIAVAGGVRCLAQPRAVRMAVEMRDAVAAQGSDMAS
jgi:hypothetical protein